MHHGGVAASSKSITLDVRRGEFLTIVGASGTGKTTLLRLLGGLTPASSGDILFRGKPVDGPPDGVVVVFQDYSHALLQWRTVASNVALGLEGRLEPASAQGARGTALEMVGLERCADDHPWQLSGGMQQRVQIARALALQPDVMLMDEPFGALDAMTKATLQDELLRVHARTGTSFVFITHDIEEAVYLGDRVVVLGGPPGRIHKIVSIDLPGRAIRSRHGSRRNFCGTDSTFMPPSLKRQAAMRTSKFNIPGLLTILVLLAGMGIRFAAASSPSTICRRPPASSWLGGSLIASGEMLAQTLHTLRSVLIGWTVAAASASALGLAARLLGVRAALFAGVARGAAADAGVAFLPLALLLFNFSLTTELVLIIYASIWPVLINTMGGVMSVPPRLYDVGRTLRLSRAHTLVKVVIPAAAPAIVVGCRLSMGLTLVMAIIAEMLANPHGLGYAVISQLQAMQPQRMFAYVIFIGLLAIVLNAACCGSAAYSCAATLGAHACVAAGHRSAVLGGLAICPRSAAVDPRLGDVAGVRSATIAVFSAAERVVGQRRIPERTASWGLRWRRRWHVRRRCRACVRDRSRSAS